MNLSEADAIINSYKPHKGFFDLSQKPSTLSKIEYAKVLRTQNFLVEQNKHSDYLRKHNPTQWDKLKELSADLQSIIFKHWGDSIFTENRVSKEQVNNAKQWVIDAFKSSTPEDVPLPFKQVVRASFKNKKKVIATLEMFDGLTGVVEVSKWADFEDAWSIRWHELDGGAINWNGTCWERINEDELFEQPHQLELELNEVPA